MVAHRLGEVPLSKPDKQKRYRDAKKTREAQKDEALDRILSAKTLREAHQIAREARGKASGRG